MKINNTLKLTLCGILAVSVLNSCSKKSDEAEIQLVKEEIGMTQVTIKTSVGEINLELDGDKAPITVKNFVDIANSGYFEGTIFHRVINGFMIQGGGLNADMSNKSSGTAPIQNEANNGLTHQPGALSMAKTSAANTGGSQFFIVPEDSNPSHLDGVHTVFGKVSSGLSSVTDISEVETGSNDMPLYEVRLLSVSIS